MSPSVVALVLLMLAAVVLFTLRGGRSAAVASEERVGLEDVPSVFSAVRDGANGTFAVFLFGPNGEDPAPMDALNLQFSVEGNTPGLDWVLLAPSNVESQDRVSDFLKARGSSVQMREMNGVSYLRTEDGDLSELAQELLTQVFGVSSNQEMILIPEGFDWLRNR